MAKGIATRSSRGHRTICVPIEEEDYLRIIHDPKAFRRTLDDCFRQTPELFPVNFALGYELKDDRMSAKQQIPIRRILLKDDSAYSIRPSFLMPYMTVRTADVEGPLFLRKFGVPFWALARVFGGDPMSWYRMECGLGRFSVVGTTVRTATLPEHLLADEHHQGLDGQKVYIATTVGNGCCLGAEPAEAAGSDKLMLKLVHQASKLLRSGGTVDVPHPAVQFAGLAAAVANLQEPVQKTEHHRDQGKQRLERIPRRRPTVGVDRLGGVLGVDVPRFGREHAVGFLEMDVIGRGRQRDAQMQPPPTVVGM